MWERALLCALQLTQAQFFLKSLKKVFKLVKIYIWWLEYKFVILKCPKSKYCNAYAKYHIITEWVSIKSRYFSRSASP